MLLVAKREIDCEYSQYQAARAHQSRQNDRRADEQLLDAHIALIGRAGEVFLWLRLGII